MKVLIIDNYDSFTYNLVHLVQSIINEKVDVIRNDKAELKDIKKYSKIILSPGPGIPNEAGKLKEIIRKYASTKSILGVCLGMQAIAEVFGAELKNMRDVCHGLATSITVSKDDVLFRSIPKVFLGGRYHSWVVSANNLPTCFEITAVDSNQNIMALAHKEFDVRGVQFHPESILTEYGREIISSWLFHNYASPINLPSFNSKEFEINNLTTKLLFC